MCVCEADLVVVVCLVSACFAVISLFGNSGMHSLVRSLVLLLAAREGACGPEPLFEPHKSNVYRPPPQDLVGRSDIDLWVGGPPPAPSEGPGPLFGKPKHGPEKRIQRAKHS